ncbi:MAG: sugar ABC transporter substrate-binding protein [Thermoflavifilum sp.]|nr:sugar ABC transporter substrate-binding protein [Thermoflavifilum sp.]MCL6514584.1 sugar ABC transporter substrate-binding protein [Alicyclobacillus sp.]
MFHFWKSFRRQTRVVISSLTVLMMILVTACGTSNSGSNTTATNQVQTVNYWYWLDDPSHNTIQDLIDQFNMTHPNIHVVGRLIPFNNYQQTLINAVSSGNAPDAARFKDWWVGQFAQNHLLTPLDSYTKQWQYTSDILPQYWDTGRTSSSSPIYMLPNEYITFYLYYRKDLFAKAHLTPPKTFDEFLSDAQKLTDPAKHQYGFAMRGGAGGQDQWYAFMLAGGARMVDSNGNIVVNNQKAVQVNQWYIDLFRKYHVAPPSSVTDSYAQLLADFENGTVAMMAHHIGSYALLQQKLGDNLGVVPMPQADPSNPATMGSMSGNVIMDSSQHKTAAWTFISWLSSPTAIDVLDRSTNAQLPVLQSVANEPFFQSNTGWKVAIEEEKYAHVWPPLPGVGAVSGHVWEQTMDQALLGQISSQQMLDQIAATLKSGQ